MASVLFHYTGEHCATYCAVARAICGRRAACAKAACGLIHLFSSVSQRCRMGEQCSMVTFRPKLCRGPAWSVHGVEHCYTRYSIQLGRIGLLQLVM